MKLKTFCDEPFRVLFPLGAFFLVWGVLLWLPQIWDSGDYPVLAHRYLMLNGFVTSFIGGFLMTAVPRFSQTIWAKPLELVIFVGLIFLGLAFAFGNQESSVFLISSMQSGFLLFFLLIRFPHRKANPPYSFIFIFVGLLLWFVSGLLSVFVDGEAFKELHYEGAIASVILGVGGRLIPGIMGHIPIVGGASKITEKPAGLLSIVPAHFLLLVILFALSYFLPWSLNFDLRALIVLLVGLFYWRIWQLPKDRSALTWSIWVTSWMIILSFTLKALWEDGVIHVTHSFFINGIVLMSLLVGTRVLQSHGPKDIALENSKILYIVSSLILLAGATRVTAFIMPETYLRHLGYSSFVLVLGVLIWSWKYLKYTLR